VYEFVVSEGDAGDLAAGASGCQISNYRGGSCGNAAGLRRDRRGEGGGHDCVVPVAGAATRYLIVYW
jgi:hypothetical protein